MSGVERNIELKVGLLVAICIGLLVVFIVVLGDISTTSGSMLYVDVETSASLKPGAVVKVAGVSAGRVVDVVYRGGEIDPVTKRPVFVRVGLRIDDDKLKTLRRDTRFYVTTAGVLGEKYVEIEPMSVEGPVLKAGDIVEAEPPLRFEVMAQNASRVLATLARTLKKNENAIDEMIVNAAGAMATIKHSVERIDALVDAAGPKVALALDKLVVVEDQMNRALEGANVVIGDGSEMRAAVANVAALSADVRERVAPLLADVRAAIARYAHLGEVAEGIVGEVKGQIAKVMDTGAAVLADAKVLTGRLKDGQGTVGALLSDREMYDDIREMMKDLKRHPWKFIWKE